eukprot:320447-Chlamydomonas_euryale.AAC.10
MKQEERQGEQRPCMRKATSRAPLPRTRWRGMGRSCALDIDQMHWISTRCTGYRLGALGVELRDQVGRWDDITTLAFLCAAAEAAARPSRVAHMPIGKLASQLAAPAAVVGVKFGQRPPPTALNSGRKQPRQLRCAVTLVATGAGLSSCGH